MTWELYRLLPEGVKSSVTAGRTTQVKGFGQAAQEFARKSSQPMAKGLLLDFICVVWGL